MDPTLIVDGEGVVSVVYRREMAYDSIEIMLNRCADEFCTSVIPIPVTPLGRNYGVTAIGTDVGVLVATTRGGQSSVALQTCAVSGCLPPADEFPGNMLGLAAQDEGPPLLAYGVFNETEMKYEIYIGFCSGSACSSHEPVFIAHIDGGLTGGGTSLHLLPDGSPVLFYPVLEDSGEQFVWNVYVCSDPKCDQVTVLEESEAWLTTEASYQHGLPFYVYPKFPGLEIRHIGCIDNACTSMSVTTLHTMDGVDHLAMAKGAWVGDSLYVLAGYASEYPPPSPWDTPRELSMFRCDQWACSQVEAAPFTHGNYFAIAPLDETAAVVAVQTGYPVLCSPDGCADPTHSLSEFSLYFLSNAGG